MEIKSLRCNHCSANLEIDSKIRYFNCSYCGSSLTIKRSGNTVYTEVIDEIKTNTDLLVNRSEQLLVEKEIERLDREWQLEREQYGEQSKHGNISYPDQSNDQSDMLKGIIALVIAIGLSVAFISFPTDGMLPGKGGPGFLKFLPVFFIIVILFNLFSGNSKKQQYKNAKLEYQAKRDNLLRQLEN